MMIVVLPPGERKSAVFRHVFEPLEEAEKRVRADARPAVERAREERDSLSAEIARLTRKARRNPDDIHRLADLRAELEAAPTPVMPRLLADDATPEVIPRLLAENDGRLCVASAEGGIFSTLRGRYSSGMVNIDVFLKGHAGDSLRVDRKNAEAIIVERPTLSAALAVQPAVLKELLGQPDFRGRGLVARFLFSLPHPCVGKRRFDPDDLDERFVSEYRTRLRDLLARPRAATPVALRFADDAREVWRAFAVEVEVLCGPDRELASMGDWVSKLPGATARLAGILHLLDRTELAHDGASTVSAQTVARAVELARYFLAHARLVLLAEVRDETRLNAEALLAWARHRPTFTLRDAQRAMKGRFTNADRAREAIAILREHGYVRARPAPAEHRGTGRPPNEVFDVHPRHVADKKPNVARAKANP